MAQRGRQPHRLSLFFLHRGAGISMMAALPSLTLVKDPVWEGRWVRSPGREQLVRLRGCPLTVDSLHTHLFALRGGPEPLHLLAPTYSMEWSFDPLPLSGDRFVAITSAVPGPVIYPPCGWS